MADRDLPALDALFLVVFDKKIGYTIKWQQHNNEISLDGVEYQSLPSGLHEIESDIIYFNKDNRLGISAFQQIAAEAEHRNAHFVAIGAILRSTANTAPQSWRYANALKGLAERISHGLDDKTPLEGFWKKHRYDTHHLSNDKPSTPSNDKNITFPDYHPFSTMPLMLRLFGPLIFPLQRTAMLGKRILFLGRPPVRQTCDMLYNLSILSRTSDQSPESQILYNVGVADLDRLSDAHAWMACTTDAILAEKKKIYDLLVEMPEHESWPILRASDGTHIKATQRDLRRYERLDNFLQQSMHQDADEHAKILRTDSIVTPSVNAAIIQPLSWSEMAYSSFMWWSSPGEQIEWLADEEETDNDLLRELQNEMSIAKTTIAFSQRFSAHVLKIIQQAVAQLEISDQSDGMFIPVEVLQQAGLDPWSQSDRDFIVELTGANTKYKVQIADAGLTICGIRVC